MAWTSSASASEVSVKGKRLVNGQGETIRLLGVNRAGTEYACADGWGFFDSNNMPILCQIARPEVRATGYGIMNLVSISCGGFADWGFGLLRDNHVPLFGIFSIFASAAVFSLATFWWIETPRLSMASPTCWVASTIES